MGTKQDDNYWKQEYIKYIENECCPVCLKYAKYIENRYLKQESKGKKSKNYETNQKV